MKRFKVVLLMLCLTVSFVTVESVTKQALSQNANDGTIAYAWGDCDYKMHNGWSATNLNAYCMTKYGLPWKTLDAFAQYFGARCGEWKVAFIRWAQRPHILLVFYDEPETQTRHQMMVTIPEDLILTPAD